MYKCVLSICLECISLFCVILRLSANLHELTRRLYFNSWRKTEVRNGFSVSLIFPNNYFFDRRKTEKKKWKGMPIKVNGDEGSLSRFALKILFLRSDSGTKRKIFRCNPSGLDLYKRPRRSYLRIPFLFLLTINIIQSR